MRKDQLTDIQKALNWIRSQAQESDAEAKIEVLSLLNGTSQSVIAMAKKLTEPKVKTKTQTKVVAQVKDRPAKQQPKVVKQGKPPESSTDLPATPFQAIKPQMPIGPISPVPSSPSPSAPQ